MAAPTVPYVDDPSCADLFAEIVTVAYDSSAQIVRIEFGVHRFSATAPSHVDHCGPVARLAISRATAESLIALLRATMSPDNAQGQASNPPQRN
jgi:hypothetical protein